MRKLLLLVLTFALILPIALPAPKTIEASSAVSPKTMAFFLECDFAYIDGVRIPVGGTPFIKQSNVMLPLRFLIQQLGGTLTLMPESNTFMIKYGGREISIQSNVAQMTVDGQITKLSQTITMRDGSNYLPLRDIASIFELRFLQKGDVIVVGSPEKELKSSLDTWTQWFAWRKAAIRKLPELVINLGINPVVKDDRIYYMDDNMNMISVKLDGSNSLKLPQNDKNFYFYARSENKYYFIDENSPLHDSIDGSIIDIADGYAYILGNRQLWSVKMDGTNARKLAIIHETPTFIHIYKGYVYYTDYYNISMGTSSLYRVHRNEGKPVLLIENYLEHNELRIVENIEYGLIQSQWNTPYQTMDDKIYYLGLFDRNLYELNLKTLKHRKLIDKNKLGKKGIDERRMYAEDGWLYFNVNDTKKNSIYRLNLTSLSMERIVEKGFLSHVLDGLVYYNDTNLFRVSMDGKNKKRISKGDMTDGDHVTSFTNDWIMFSRYYGIRNTGDYKVKYDGSMQIKL